MTITHSQAQGLLNLAKGTAKGENQGINSAFFHRIFIAKGATIRFHPYLDVEGSPFRVLYRHITYKPNPIELACTGDSCNICKNLKTMPNWTTKWKFEARKVSFGYAMIFNLTNSKVTFDWHDTPVVLMHRSYDLALSQMIERLGGVASVVKFFDPESESPVVLARSDGTNGNLFMEILGTTAQRSCPALFGGLKPLSAYLKPTDFDRAKEYEFIKAVNRDLEMEIGYIRRHVMDPAVPEVKGQDSREVGKSAGVTDAGTPTSSLTDSLGTATGDSVGIDQNEREETMTSANQDERGRFTDNFDEGDEILAEYEYWKEERYREARQNDVGPIEESASLEIGPSGIWLIRK